MRIMQQIGWFLPAGQFLKPVTVDNNSIVVIDDLRAPVRAVYVPPSHQYSTGVAFSIN
jgi:hypothetical protein